MLKLLYSLIAITLIFHPDPVNAEETFVKTEGANLYTQTMGTGNPLIILHGGAGFLTHDYLLPHMERLSKNNLVVLYDQRALGKSTGEPIPEQINLKTYIEDLDAVRTSLGATKISLLGHSFGSFLALHYALAHPEAVDKLILTSSMPIASQDLGLFFPELAKRLAPYQEELKKIESSEAYLSGDPETVENQLRIVFQTYMYNPENIHKVNLWKSQKAAVNGFKVWDIFKEQIFMKPYDMAEQLKTVQNPTLIIHGDTDPISFIAAKHIHEALPSSTLIKIEQSGHFPFVEQPEPFFKAIDDFLKN